jgi:hypothetical protein
MKRLLVFGALVLACGDEPSDCNPIGRWTLQETTTSGDCAELGAAQSDELTIADAGGSFVAQLAGPAGLVECEGRIEASCAGELACTTTVEAPDGASAMATLRFALHFDGSRATGTAALTVSGDLTCSASATVAGTR